MTVHTLVPPSPALDAVRQQIDCLDAHLLELLARRQALAAEVAAAKAPEPDRLRLRPGRERQVMRRLGRLGVAPPALVEGVWRQLMSHSLQVQEPLRLVVHAPARPVAVTDAARRRFGGGPPLEAAPSAAAAVAAAARSSAVAVIEHHAHSDWWTALPDEPALRIFDVLRADHGELRALLVGRVGAEDVVGPAFEVLTLETAERRGLEPIAVCGTLALCDLGAADS